MVLYEFVRTKQLSLLFGKVPKKKSYRQRMIEAFEKDPFGLNEPIELVSFVCTKCHEIDEVPAYLIGKFMVDKKQGEEVSLECPKCNGEMFQTRNNPSE
ncbi:hypothetical protein [Solibacillus sp. FSL H8-0538]|uniref:hypothetical protein n=1 Tax=Solibacillus sp. FSL H8-0538 TaxID=2921400 RepID=UPI0030FA1F60